MKTRVDHLKACHEALDVARFKTGPLVYLRRATAHAARAHDESLERIIHSIIRAHRNGQQVWRWMDAVTIELGEHIAVMEETEQETAA